jgi:hypothetical protein
LLKLADKYSVIRLEAACAKAFLYSATPSFRSVRTILKTGSDTQDVQKEHANDMDSAAYGFTRGVAYYGGDQDGE